MGLPYLEFYPGDWAKDPNVRRLTLEEKGAVLEAMLLCHDSEIYGVLRWPLVDIAAAVRAPIALMRLIVKKGVLRGAEKKVPAFVHVTSHAGRQGDPVTLIEASEEPMYYFPGMVLAAWRRQRRGATTRFTSENNPAGKVNAGNGEYAGTVNGKGHENGSPSRSPSGRVGDRQGDRQGDGSSPSPSPSSSISTEPPTLDALKAFAVQRRVPESAAVEFWNWKTGEGWVGRDGEPMWSVQGSFMAWWKKRAAKQRPASSPRKVPAVSPIAAVLSGNAEPTPPGFFTGLMPENVATESTASSPSTVPPEAISILDGINARQRAKHLQAANAGNEVAHANA
jgi:hypothetical protein